MQRIDDLGRGQAAHHTADGHRVGIVSCVADPATHRRLYRKIMVAHQYFAGCRCRHRSLPDRKVFGLRNTRGPGRQNNLPVFHQPPFSTETTVTTPRIPTLDNQPPNSTLLRLCSIGTAPVCTPTPTSHT